MAKDEQDKLVIDDPDYFKNANNTTLEQIKDSTVYSLYNQWEASKELFRRKLSEMERRLKDMESFLPLTKPALPEQKEQPENKTLIYDSRYPEGSRTQLLSESLLPCDGRYSILKENADASDLRYARFIEYLITREYMKFDPDKI